MDISHIIILFGISIAQIAMEQPFKIWNVDLKWTDARQACRNSKSHLINFFEMQTRLEYFKKEFVLYKKYWVAETWIPRLFFVRGCQSKIQVLSTEVFQENLFSECVKYCKRQNFTTIGIQGFNCSCVVDEKLQNLEYNSCDLGCATNSIQCRAEKQSFAVYTLAKGVPERLPGKLFHNCVYFNKRSNFTRNDCNQKLPFICQDKTGEFILQDTPSTWMEASKNCSKRNMILANVNRNAIPRKNIIGNYWIGVRQMYIYQTDMKSSLCSLIQKYNPINDLRYSREDCSTKYSYLCVEDPASMTLSIKTVQRPAVIAGVIAGITGTVALVILIVVCLFLRIRKKNPRSKYISPTVTFSSTAKRDSNISQDRSVKATPLKPARRSKKSNPASLAEGTAYENIVLTLEDPATISRVVSSSSTEQKQDVKDVESSYDVMGAFKTNNNAASISQNVYGFSVPDNEYDVMDRGKRHTEEVNPDYDHM